MTPVVFMQQPDQVGEPKSLHNNNTNHNSSSSLQSFVIKPRNPKVQARSTSTESHSTCTTTLSASDRMDWTITSNNEHTDRTFDGDDEPDKLCFPLDDTKMKLVPEETVSSSDSIRKNTIVEFQEEPITIHEPKQAELKNEGVPTSVQIHRAFPPESPSKRMTKTAEGKLRRQVCFHQVQIRRYPMIAGDNPACQMGAPVQLDWGFEELPALDLDDFEATRSQTRRRKLHHLLLNYFHRNRILLGVGYTEEEIKQFQKENGRERFRRDITKMLVPFWKVEDCIQSLKRKLKRMMSKEEKSKKEEESRSIRLLQARDSIRR